MILLTNGIIFDWYVADFSGSRYSKKLVDWMPPELISLLNHCKFKNEIKAIRWEKLRENISGLYAIILYYRRWKEKLCK